MEANIGRQYKLNCKPRKFDAKEARLESVFIQVYFKNTGAFPTLKMIVRSASQNQFQCIKSASFSVSITLYREYCSLNSINVFSTGE